MSTPVKEDAHAKAIRRLKKLQANGDIERDHAKADDKIGRAHV